MVIPCAQTMLLTMLLVALTQALGNAYNLRKRKAFHRAIQTNTTQLVLSGLSPYDRFIRFIMAWRIDKQIYLPTCSLLRAPQPC